MATQWRRRRLMSNAGPDVHGSDDETPAPEREEEFDETVNELDQMWDAAVAGAGGMPEHSGSIPVSTSYWKTRVLVPPSAIDVVGSAKMTEGELIEASVFVPIPRDDIR
jgi:hypothetical protein